MALIKCPECGQQISGDATACVHCGFVLRATNRISKRKVWGVLPFFHMYSEEERQKHPERDYDAVEENFHKQFYIFIIVAAPFFFLFMRAMGW